MLKSKVCSKALMNGQKKGETLLMIQLLKQVSFQECLERMQWGGIYDVFWKLVPDSGFVYRKWSIDKSFLYSQDRRSMQSSKIVWHWINLIHKYLGQFRYSCWWRAHCVGVFRRLIMTSWSLKLFLESICVGYIWLRPSWHSHDPASFTQPAV